MTNRQWRNRKNKHGGLARDNTERLLPARQVLWYQEWWLGSGRWPVTAGMPGWRMHKKGEPLLCFCRFYCVKYYPAGVLDGTLHKMGAFANQLDLFKEGV